MNKNYRNLMVLFVSLFVIFVAFAAIFENFEMFEETGEMGEVDGNFNNNSVNTLVGPGLVRGLLGLSFIALFGIVIVGCIGFNQTKKNY